MPTVIYDRDHEAALSLMEGPGASLCDAIARAIATERERCAKIVENMGRSNGRIMKTHKVIATEIRSAKDRIGKQR